MSEACEMPSGNATPEEVRDILKTSRVVAVVGLSDKPDRDSYHVAAYLQRAGYRVIPVNPRETEVLGEKAYASLEEVPVHVDIVDVFRRADDTPPIADAAVKIGARALWLQTGIRNEDTAARAGAGGLTVVMDACLAATHTLLQVPAKTR